MNASMPVLRVLLVDDEPLARTRLRSLLADISHPATEVCGEAESAAQTMALLENTRPDVVLLDIHMPGMDGMQLAQRISRAGGLPQIIFVTASMDFALQAFDVAAAESLCALRGCSRPCSRLLRPWRCSRGGRRCSRWHRPESMRQRARPC